MKQYPMTICGLPVEFSSEAPKDKVVLHPEVAAHIEFAMLKLSKRVEVINAPESNS